MRVGLLSPVWFPVPPTGYGGIEWVVALLADGLVEAGHEVTLFASGDSQTKARSSCPSTRRHPRIRSARRSPELDHALACYERAGGVRRHQRPLGHCRCRARGHGRDAGRPHRARAARRRGRGRSTSASLAWFPARADLALPQPAQAEAGPALDRELPERARPDRVSRAAPSRRLPPLSGPPEPRQGRPPRHRGREGDRSAAEDRRQDARRRSRSSTSSRARTARASAGASSIWARCRTRRRSTSSRTPGRRSSRSTGRSRSASS